MKKYTVNLLLQTIRMLVTQNLNHLYNVIGFVAVFFLQRQFKRFRKKPPSIKIATFPQGW